MPSVDYELGQEVVKNGRTHRVVRIVQQTSLFEGESGPEVITEHLVELKGDTGGIDFEVLTSERTEYTGITTSTIKAPEPINWKRD